MATVRDPVCGMRFPEEQCAATRAHWGRTYGFCCEHCAGAFADDPERFVGGDADADADADAVPGSATGTPDR